MTITVNLIGSDSEWAAGQDNPHIPVNEGIAVALILRLTLKGKGTSTPPGSPAEGDAYIIGASPTGDWSTFTQDNIAYYDNGSWREMNAVDDLTLTADDGSGGTLLWRYVSGTGWTQVFLQGATPYDVPVVKGDTPTASEVIGRFTLARAIDFPADFAGSVGSVETNPTASFAIDVQDDGTSIGTITISTAGAYTFATSGGAAKTVAAGSKLEFIAPASTDATIAGISLMLLGTTG